MNVWIAILLGLGFSARVMAADTNAAPRRIILSIGIGSHSDPRWPQLQFAEKDARDVFEKLTTQGYSGLLLTGAEAEKAVVTRDAMRAALTRIAQQNIHEDDTVIIYYSGHGTLAMATDPKTRGFGLRKFFVAADTRLDEIAGTGLAQDEVLALFARLKSRRKALIIDACHAGGGKAYLSPAVLALLAMQKGPGARDLLDEAVEGSGIFTASASGEEALEMKELRNGIYTHFLLQGMSKDMDGDGAVRLSEAHAFASQRVLEYTKNSQHPTASMEFVGKDPLVVFGEATREGGPILYAWQWALRKYDVYVDGKHRGNLSKGGIAVPDGTRQLTLRDPETKDLVLERTVQFKSGNDYSVADYFVPRTPHLLTFNAAWQQWKGGEVKRSLPEATETALGLSYAYQEVWRTFDLALRYSHVLRQATEARITLDLAGRTFTEERQQYLTQNQLDIGLGQHSRIAMLSSRTLGLETSFFWNGGASGLLVDRELPGLSESEGKRRAFLPGGWMQSGFQWRFERGRLLLTSALDGVVFKNELGDAGTLVSHYGIQLGLGSYW